MTGTHNQTPCSTCQGNGEVITDWERYLEPHAGDRGDEAVSTCPDCRGSGRDHAQAAAVQ